MDDTSNKSITYSRWIYKTTFILDYNRSLLLKMNSKIQCVYMGAYLILSYNTSPLPQITVAGVKYFCIMTHPHNIGTGGNINYLLAAFVVSDNNLNFTESLISDDDEPIRAIKSPASATHSCLSSLKYISLSEVISN